MSTFPTLLPNVENWDEISLHLEILQSLPDADQNRYLESISKENPALYKTLFSLVSHDKEWSKLLQNASDYLNPALCSKPFKDDFLTGKTIEGYKVLEKIGQGGMSDVYKAERMNAYNQIVAFKVFHANVLSPELYKNFGQEQRLLAYLNHKHLAYFIDAGQTEEGMLYLVMEYIEGQDIKTWCVENKASVEDILKLILQICEVLQYLHVNLVVHRDIKPSNIIVTQDRFIKLLDLGIAKVLATAEESQTATKTLFRALTLNFASPEQYFGQPITIQSDVYSLGVLLYHLLTDDVPFDLKGTPMMDWNTLLSKTPLPPSQKTRVISKGKRNIDADLDAIILKAIRQEPYMRYANIDAFGKDIEHWLRHEPIHARPITWYYQLNRFVKRNRVTTALVSLLLIVLLTATGITFWQSFQIKQQVQKSEAITRFLEHIIQGYDPFSPDRIEQDSTETQQLIHRSLSYLNTLPKTEIEVKASVLNLLSEIASNQNNIVQADSLNKKAFRLIANAPQTLPNLYAQLLLQQGKIYALKGEYQKSLKIANQGLTLVTNSNVETQKIRLDLLNLLCEMHAQLENFSEVNRFQQEAFILAKQVFGDQSVEMGFVLSQSAKWYYAQSNFDQAGKLMRQSIEINKKYYPNDAPYFATLYNDLSVILQDQKKFSEAQKAIEESVRIYEKNFGLKHVRTIKARGNWATLLFLAQKQDAAGDILAENIQLAQSLPLDYTNLDIQNLAIIRFNQNRYSEAETLIRSAISRHIKVYKPDNDMLLNCSYTLGNTLYKLKQEQSATREFNNLIRITEGRPDLKNSNLKAKLRLGYIAYDRNNTPEVEKIILETEQALKNGTSRNIIREADIKALTGFLALKKGKHTQGFTHIREVLEVLRTELGEQDFLYIDILSRFEQAQRKYQEGKLINQVINNRNG